jgi:sec-independent protein translocase protein TatA
MYYNEVTALSQQLANLVMVIGIEWIIIIVVIVLVFFGVKKIPQLARSFGKASVEYRKSKIEAEKELEHIKGKPDASTIDREKLETIAETLGIDYSNKNDDELRDAIDKEVNKGKE